jgi:amino acid transporter
MLTISSLVMITIGSIDSIRNLPASALFSESLIFFYALAALAFFIPTALIAAELATGWPSRGGVYTWVREAFGPRAGLFAIWYQWIGTVIWYPTILSFLAGAIAQITLPELSDKPWFMSAIILSTFWLATLANLRGMQTSAWVAKICTTFGLIVPILLITSFAAIWIMSGNETQLAFEAGSLLPQLEPSTLIGLTAIILSCCGIEITSTHALEVESPQRDYPRAMLISVAAIISALILGSLSIAIILPKEEISLVTGLMQAFETVLRTFHLESLLPFLGVTIIFSVFGVVNNWVIGPCKGLLFSLKEMNVAPFLHYENKQQVPAGILIFQACVCSALSLVFFLMPTVNSSYWVLTVLATQLYLIMYCLLFSAAFWLRFKRPDVFRAYKIPGGKWGIGLVCLCGILSCLITIAVGFYPPANMGIANPFGYTLAIIVGLILFSCPPFLFYHSYKKQKPVYQAIPIHSLMNDK